MDGSFIAEGAIITLLIANVAVTTRMKARVIENTKGLKLSSEERKQLKEQGCDVSRNIVAKMDTWMDSMEQLDRQRSKRVDEIKALVEDMQKVYRETIVDHEGRIAFLQGQSKRER
jgi:tRNA U54 and U55 pseudouridine synthase Pus10